MNTTCETWSYWESICAGRRVVLNNIRIVLVRPTHPGNIGAVARAMKNLYLQRLYLVAPDGFPSVEASARAAGADDLLASAPVCESLDQALDGCHLVIGSSARTRRIEWPELDPQACGEMLAAAAHRGPVALLLGRERTGLTNEELDRCHFLVHIPTNPDFASLNLAGAAHILGYEIERACARAELPPAGARKRTPVPVGHEEMARFYRHLQEVLVHVGFLDPKQPRLLMRRLIRLFNRTAPNQNEMNMLRGILTAVLASREKT